MSVGFSAAVSEWPDRESHWVNFQDQFPSCFHNEDSRVLAAAYQPVTRSMSIVQSVGEVVLTNKRKMRYLLRSIWQSTSGIAPAITSLPLFRTSAFPLNDRVRYLIHYHIIYHIIDTLFLHVKVGYRSRNLEVCTEYTRLLSSFHLKSQDSACQLVKMRVFRWRVSLWSYGHRLSYGLDYRQRITAIYDYQYNC